MIATIPPPTVPLISLGIITEETDVAATDNAHSDSGTEPLESVLSDLAHAQETASMADTEEGTSKVLPLPLPPVTGELSPSQTRTQPLWAKDYFLKSDATLPPNPYGTAFEESSLSSVAVHWPLDAHILPSDLCDPVGVAEERFEVPWGKKTEEESVPECAESELNSSGKDKETDKDRDDDDDAAPGSTGALSTTRHLSFPLYSSKERDRDTEPEFRSSSQRSLRDSDELKTVRTYSRTQSLLILGSESLDEKLRRRLSAVEFPIGKIAAKNKGKEKLSEKVKGKERVEVRDKEKEIEDILKERLVGVRGSRSVPTEFPFKFKFNTILLL
jgi:hypothetical protein